MTTRTSILPVTRDLTLAYVSSLVICVGIVVASIAGLAWHGLYRDVPSALVSQGGDVASLVAVLPILVGSMIFARRGSLVGLLWWPGALFYALYTYAIYLFAAPFTALAFLYVALVVLSTTTLIGLLASIDGARVREIFAAAHARTVGGALVVVGVAAYAGLVGNSLGSLGSDSFALRPQWGVDMAIGTPVLVLGGALLWRRVPLGYVVTTGLLLVSALGGIAFAVAALFDNSRAAPSTDPAVIVVHLVISAVSAAFLVFFTLARERRLGRLAPLVASR